MADTERALTSSHMEKLPENPPVQEIQQDDPSPAEKTPLPLPAADQRPPISVDDGPVDLPKRKAINFLERYKSPTDLMMSPVSRGLMARNRKTAALPIHGINQPERKVLESKIPDVGPFPA
ncbi:unnamed protein product [Victoria cruziana]